MSREGMSEEVLRLWAIDQGYEIAGRRLAILQNLELTLRAGEIVGVLGPSGAGKTSLLNIAGLLERPTRGEVWILGQQMQRGRALDRFRGEKIGFVHQRGGLLSEFSVLENVMIPQLILGRSARVAQERARGLLEKVGLGERGAHRLGELSGGERQRLALARALANGPPLLLADEPTGNLDPNTASRVFDVLIEQSRDAGVSALVVTHNPALAERLDRRFTLREGVLETL